MGLLKFHGLNPSGRIMTLGSIQPLTEMNSRDISRVVKADVASIEDLAAFMCRLLRNSGSLNLLEP
jgi:hypothetical protein